MKALNLLTTTLLPALVTEFYDTGSHSIGCSIKNWKPGILSSILLRYACLVFGQVHRGGGHVTDGPDMGCIGGPNSSTSTPNEPSN